MKHLYLTNPRINNDFLKSVDIGHCVETDRELPHAYCSQRAKELKKAVIHYERSENGIRMIKREIYFPSGRCVRKVF